MTRRELLLTAAGAAIAGQPAVWANDATPGGYQKLGLNSYCLRAMKWTDRQVLDYAAGLKLDGVFLQDSLDPQRESLAHWHDVGEYAKKLGLHLEMGIGPVLPVSDGQFAQCREQLLTGLARANACGSPLVRCLHAGDRAHLPPVPMKQNIANMVKLLKQVEPRFRDGGVKVAIENHKDLQAWEMREVIETAGKEWVGSYLDTGNPVFVAEDPVVTVETLAPYTLCAHLRDSVVYERPGGAMVEWVPLGEGDVDFARITATVRRTKPDIYVYVKPITGRPAQMVPYLTPDFWASYPDARAAELARFLALAKRGAPYEKQVVLEDIGGASQPAAFLPAIQYQQKEHMERSVAYARNTLKLGNPAA